MNFLIGGENKTRRDSRCYFFFKPVKKYVPTFSMLIGIHYINLILQNVMFSRMLEMSEILKDKQNKYIMISHEHGIDFYCFFKVSPIFRKDYLKRLLLQTV